MYHTLQYRVCMYVGCRVTDTYIHIIPVKHIRMYNPYKVYITQYTLPNTLAVFERSFGPLICASLKAKKSPKLFSSNTPPLPLPPSLRLMIPKRLSYAKIFLGTLCGSHGTTQLLCLITGIYPGKACITKKHVIFPN